MYALVSTMSISMYYNIFSDLLHNLCHSIGSKPLANLLALTGAHQSHLVDGIWCMPFVFKSLNNLQICWVSGKKNIFTFYVTTTSLRLMANTLKIFKYVMSFLQNHRCLEPLEVACGAKANMLIICISVA